jgi:hypothetical protein
LLPLQPPEAVQEVALVELQVRVLESPIAIEVGLALRLTATGLTVTVAEAELEFPEPSSQFRL